MQRPTKRLKTEIESDPIVTFESSSKAKSNLLICEASTNTLIGHKVRFVPSFRNVFLAQFTSRIYRQDIERQERHMVFLTVRGIMRLSYYLVSGMMDMFVRVG